MPPLTRVDSFPSIYSWWSDSNPTGPTISLHAAAKPLMKFLYFRQARDYIKAHENIPLARNTMEVFASYLGYTSSNTKVLVLRELLRRAKSKDALMIKDLLGEADPMVLELLRLPIAPILSNTCELLAALIAHPSTSPSFDSLKSTVCLPLSSLLRNNDTSIRRASIHCLSEITISLQGCEAASHANVPDGAVTLLSESDTASQVFACRVLENLASFSSTLDSVIAVRSCQPLISLVREASDMTICASALSTLATLSVTPSGAVAVVQGGVIFPAFALFGSPVKLSIQELIFTLLGNLVSNESTSGQVSAAFIQWLTYTPAISVDGVQVADPADMDTHVWRNTVFLRNLLAAAATCADGQKVLDMLKRAGGIFSVLLSSHSLEEKQGTCRVIKNILQDRSVQALALALPVTPMLVSFCSSSSHCPHALRALSGISYWLEGAEGVVLEQTLALTTDLLSSGDDETVKSTCELLKALASHQSTAEAVLVTQPCVQLVWLSRYHNEPSVRRAALFALSKICYWSQGARAAVEQNITPPKDIPIPDLCFWWTVLGNLARHPETYQVVLDMKPYHRLINERRYADMKDVHFAFYALSKISYWEEGASAIVRAKGLENLDKFLRCSNISAWVYTCAMLANMARHKYSRTKILGSNLCSELATVLGDPDVHAHALCALSLLDPEYAEK